jgi:hypothetical protein
MTIIHHVTGKKLAGIDFDICSSVTSNQHQRRRAEQCPILKTANIKRRGRRDTSLPRYDRRQPASQSKRS